MPLPDDYVIKQGARLIRDVDGLALTAQCNCGSSTHSVRMLSQNRSAYSLPQAAPSAPPTPATPNHYAP